MVTHGHTSQLTFNSHGKSAGDASPNNFYPKRYRRPNGGAFKEHFNVDRSEAVVDHQEYNSGTLFAHTKQQSPKLPITQGKSAL